MVRDIEIKTNRSNKQSRLGLHSLAPPANFRLEALLSPLTIIRCSLECIYGLLDMFVANLVELDLVVFSAEMRTDIHAYIL